MIVKMPLFRLAAATLMLLLVGCTTQSGNPRVVGKYTFNAWPGPALKVFYVEPEGLAPDAPVVIVMHGVYRNAEEYRDNWIDLARQQGLRIYVPQFSRSSFPGPDAYNSGAPNRRGIRSFEAIEPLFASIQARHDGAPSAYTIFGHSAGAQFVHRFMCFAETPHLGLAIAANAGWYTLPSRDEVWPYGLTDVPSDLCTPETWLTKPLLVMLGDQDIDPQDPNLRNTPETLRQGPHRFARGLNFLQVAKSQADLLGVTPAWTFERVEGIAHDNAGMAQAAAPMIAQATRQEHATLVPAQ